MARAGRGRRTTPGRPRRRPGRVGGAKRGALTGTASAPGRGGAPGPHGYPAAVAHLFVRLVLSGGCSLRGASRVLGILCGCMGHPGKVPHWTTGRLWLVRLGLDRLLRPKGRPRDRAWLIDHSVQIGPGKLLVVLGVRLADLPPPGRPLRPADLELIALRPMRSCTRRDVADRLEEAAAAAGVPRVIVDDHGVDVHGGALLFQARHPLTAEVYDAKHKAACLLKRLLAKDGRWAAFNARVGPARNAVQQTALAFLIPPGPRPKARYMNLGPLLNWAWMVLAVLAAPCRRVLGWVSRDRLRDKLGWLEGYADAPAEWREWQSVIDHAVAGVGRDGVGGGSGGFIPRPLRFAGSEDLAAELESFVAEQGRRARPGQRFPGSTEALESCFGRFKALERGQSKGGLTALTAAFGAVLREPDAAEMGEALRRCRTGDVRKWCEEHLGTTLTAKRKIAYDSARASKAG